MMQRLLVAGVDIRGREFLPSARRRTDPGAGLRAWALLLAMALSVVATARAETRAWIDGGRGRVGEALVLNIETDQAAATPDLSPLMRDFSLVDQSSDRSVQWSNGSFSAKTRYAVTLVPRREGRMTIQALRVGNEFSQPFPLEIGAGGGDVGADPAAAAGNADAFLETLVDDPHPYVQQSVGLVLRFNYTDAVNSGSFGIDAPDGASMQQVGQDRYSTRLVGGREYKVVERHYVLVPERSGRLVIPAPRFEGRSNGDLFGAFFGGGRALRINGQARVLEVQAQPGDAPQPWLPLRDLRLRYVGVAPRATAGEAATLGVEMVAEGATRAQLPELPAPSVPGAQVFADPAQYDESFVDGVPQVKLTRRFSIVPERAGTLRIAGIRLPWFDVRSDGARLASLPDVSLVVAPGAGNLAAPGAAAARSAPGQADATLPPSPAVGRWWPWLAAGFALLWLLTLLWALLRRHPRAAEPASPSGQGAVARFSAGELKRALDTGTLGEIGAVLCGLHAPPLPDLDAVLAELDDPRQRAAIELLRRARWANGDGPGARSALRAAFHGGPAWRAAAAPGTEPLPPLYPRS